MTDIDLSNVELKNAEVTAVVGDKQISAKVEDKSAAEQMKAKMEEYVNSETSPV